MWERLVKWFKKLLGNAPEIHREENGLWWQKEQSTVKIGLDSKIIKELGSITFFDTPQIGEQVQKGDQLIDIEGGKAVETFKSPFGGKIVDVRSEFEDNPSLLSGKTDPALVTVEI
ncbi:MAG: glycine cleavage system protein H [Limosilactobacillus sp.]|jgi:glycine cleavage system H protein|uniref:glycine cleavage system protein H n=1 Tax=Limosilactobacillus sp. TaxID=2773925 RepID=UPI0025BE43EE|nr:glycine cleavage system protein H [Limosilactobacillus sp.]MCI1974349.1 glycine cleavage system protein H [Limosilactobacillus sp.]MCI2030536.1 glycine cleavage system protein H [Limosilactobacillus sp.]